MHGINNIRKVKGLDYINDAYKPKVKKSIQDEPQPVPTPIKKKSIKKPLKKKSAKQKVVDRELKKLSTIMLAKFPECQIKSPVCTGQAVCLHHVNGRGLIDVLNPKKLKTSCGPCNTWVEVNDKKARELGHKKSKF